MKKWGKIFLGVLAAILLIAAGTLTPEVEATPQDLFWFRMSGVMLLLVLICGVLIELDAFHIKKHIPLARSSQIGHHILFGVLCILLSAAAFGGCYSMTSPEFRAASSTLNAQKKAEKEILEQEVTPDDGENTNADVSINNTAEVDPPKETVQEEIDSVETEPTESEGQSADSEITDGTDDSPPAESWVAPAEPELDEPYLIEEEVYPLTDEKYSVQGVEITFQSARLKRSVKPEGYTIDLEYTLQNTNSTEATVWFLSQGSEFHADERVGGMTPQATHSKNYKTSYRLEVGETTDSFIAEYFAGSTQYERTINGVIYPSVDLANVYSDQTIELAVLVSVNLDGNSDSTTIVLPINQA